MNKVDLINGKDFFKESEKVINIVKEREEEVRQSLPLEQKLQIANESLKKVKSREEHEKLTHIIKDLEFDLKYGADYIEAIPKEYQQKVAFNRVYEEEKLDEELDKQKKLLNESVKFIGESFVNILRNMETLNERKIIGRKIDVLLDEEIVLDARIKSTFKMANYLSQFYLDRDVIRAREDAERFIKSLNEIIDRPTKEKNAVKPSILSEILGGKK